MASGQKAKSYFKSFLKKRSIRQLSVDAILTEIYFTHVSVNMCVCVCALTIQHYHKLGPAMDSNRFSLISPPFL